MWLLSLTWLLIDCRTVFLGNTMSQFAPDGRIMFLHTNLSPKWSLEIPGNFSLYRRRWKVSVQLQFTSSPTVTYGRMHSLLAYNVMTIII